MVENNWRFNRWSKRKCFGCTHCRSIGASTLATGGASILVGTIGACGGCYLGKIKADSDLIDEKLKHLNDAEKQEIKLDIYSSALELLFDSIKNNDWVGKDLIAAKLNFDKERHDARVEFRKEGILLKPEENTSTLFANFRERLINLMKKYDINTNNETVNSITISNQNSTEEEL